MVKHHEADFHRAKDLIAFCIAKWLLDNGTRGCADCLDFTNVFTKYFMGILSDRKEGISSEPDL